MELSLIEDWSILPGKLVHLRHEGRTVCTGIVDSVTVDGGIVWVRPDAGTRKLFEKALGFEAWVRGVDDDAILDGNASNF